MRALTDKLERGLSDGHGSENEQNGAMAEERTEKDRALHRVQKALEAVATYARIREELLTIRLGTPLGAPRDRIDQMIRLNQETLEAMRLSLSIAEAEVTGESVR